MTTKMVVLGELAAMPVKVTHNGIQERQITLSVRRNYQNPDSSFSFDKVDVIVWRGAADYIGDVVKIGDNIHVCGRFETDKNDQIIMFGEQVEIVK